MLTDMVTTFLLFRGFRVTRDPVETGYVPGTSQIESEKLRQLRRRIGFEFFFDKAILKTNHWFSSISSVCQKTKRVFILCTVNTR